MNRFYDPFTANEMALVRTSLCNPMTCQNSDNARTIDSPDSMTMAALPVGMYLVNALDDTELLTDLEPMSDALSATSDHMRHALPLPLESSNAALDVEMNIDVDVFCPSVMLDADAFQSDSGDGLFDSRFYPGT